MYRTSIITLLLCTLVSSLLLTGCPRQPDLAVSASSHHFGIDPNTDEYETEWTFEVWNSGGRDSTLVFAATPAKPWIEVTPISGQSTGSDDKVTITVRINRDYAAAKSLEYATGAVLISASVAAKAVEITTAPDYFTQVFDSGENNLEGLALTWNENSGPSFYGQTKSPITDFPTDPTGGLLLDFESFGDPVKAGLFGDNEVSFYGESYDTLYISSQGWVSFGEAGNNADSLGDHFEANQITALPVDATQPGSMVSYLQDNDKLVITYEDVPSLDKQGSLNSFQIELFFDGGLQLSFLNIDPSMSGIIGLSNATGADGNPPDDFIPSDLEDANTAPLKVALD